MDKIDMLLQHVTDNTDQIIEGIENNEESEMSQEELFDMLLQMVVDGEIELIQDENGIKFKLPKEDQSDEN